MLGLTVAIRFRKFARTKQRLMQTPRRISHTSNNYAGMFGVPRIEKYNRSTNENWYIIEQKSNLNDFFDDNPSKLYSFYYVMNNTLENGIFLKRLSLDF